MWNLIKFIIWVSIPFLLWFLPANYFDTGESICLSQVLLDKECPGCGITRSVQHAMHLDFASAWRYNKLIVLVLPFLVYLWASQLIILFTKIKNK